MIKSSNSQEESPVMSEIMSYNVPCSRRFSTLEGDAHALLRANAPTVPTGLG